PVELRAEQEPLKRKFTVKEYYLMAKAGVFDPDERLELLEGEIIRMSPKGTKHAASTSQAARYFIERLSNRAIVRAQDPVYLDEYSEPEPDVALVIPDEKRYLDHHPKPEMASMNARSSCAYLNFSSFVS
ncbi:MAG TPA: Uma2 family endonuclease, partial [Blastocatellia bacterium]|nr:Uma2 family endonuclease [Blastocatellia bacterium]